MYAYSLSQILRHTLKHDSKIGKRIIWNNFIKNTQNVNELKHSRNYWMCTSAVFIEKMRLSWFLLKKLLTQNFRHIMQIKKMDWFQQTIRSNPPADCPVQCNSKYTIWVSYLRCESYGAHKRVHCKLI